MNYDVKNLELASEGRKRIEWADAHMPVLRKIREEFAKTRPLTGVKIAACLHVTTETANLMRTLKEGGAEIALTASNPLSTQDETAAYGHFGRNEPGFTWESTDKADDLRKAVKL